MAITIVPLITPQQVANATTTYLTATKVSYRVDKLTVTNPTATAATITLYLVPTAGAAGDSTTISKTKSVGAGETWNCPDFVGQVLGDGTTLQAVASAAATLTLSAAGVRIT